MRKTISFFMLFVLSGFALGAESGIDALYYLPAGTQLKVLQAIPIAARQTSLRFRDGRMLAPGVGGDYSYCTLELSSSSERARVLPQGATLVTSGGRPYVDYLLVAPGLMRSFIRLPLSSQTFKSISCLGYFASGRTAPVSYPTVNLLKHAFGSYLEVQMPQAEEVAP